MPSTSRSLKRDPATAAALGIVSGALYFAAGESKISRAANCSYLAAPVTDVLAWAAGAYLMIEGSRTNDPEVAFIGGAITGIHVSQFAAHKVTKRGQ